MIREQKIKFDDMRASGVARAADLPVQIIQQSGWQGKSTVFLPSPQWDFLVALLSELRR
jgi:hypothetical protein